MGAVPLVHLPVMEKGWPAAGAGGFAESVQPDGATGVDGVVVPQLTGMVMTVPEPSTFGVPAVHPLSSEMVIAAAGPDAPKINPAVATSAAIGVAIRTLIEISGKVLMVALRLILLD
jgi:hypothetical protein